MSWGGRPRARKIRPGDRVPIGFRVTRELKRQIEKVARQSGRSQSQEMEFRLELSFMKGNPKMADTDNKPLAPVAKPPLVAGGQIAAIVPRDFESAYRMAQVVVAAKMTPASLDTPEKACVAIMHGLEVGLTPMAALQSIAVINGMPTIWGDGMLALVRASGLLEDIIEDVELDDKGDPTIATCKVKRRGEPQWAISQFSRVEAQKAGLWNKRGPWEGYKARMLKMRARSWALRDKFADVLRGLHMAEEMMDITPSGGASTAPPEPRRYRAVVQDAEPAAPVPPLPVDGAASGPAAVPLAAEPPPVSPDVYVEPTLNDWTVPDGLIGQDAVITHLVDLIELAQSEADLDAIEQRNAARLSRITGTKGAMLRQALRDRRTQIKGGT